MGRTARATINAGCPLTCARTAQAMETGATVLVLIVVIVFIRLLFVGRVHVDEHGSQGRRSRCTRTRSAQSR